MRVFFEDGSDEFFTVAAPTLASYQAVLSQPRVFYDPNNHFFTTERMEGAAFHAA